MASKKVPDLKKLSSDSTRAEKEEITGFEETVVQLRKLDEQIEQLQQVRDGAYGFIMNSVGEAFKANCANGKLVKSYVIKSKDGVPATVLYKNAYSKLDAVNEEAMRKVLGEFFDTFYSVDTDTKMKRDADIKKMKELLGDRFYDFFTDTKMITFTKEFMEKKMDMRDKLPKTVAVMLDEFAKQCQSKPDFRLPPVEKTNNK